jgi:hypothetical protein
METEHVSLEPLLQTARGRPASGKVCDFPPSCCTYLDSLLLHLDSRLPFFLARPSFLSFFGFLAFCPCPCRVPLPLPLPLAPCPPPLPPPVEFALTFLPPLPPVLFAFFRSDSLSDLVSERAQDRGLADWESGEGEWRGTPQPGRHFRLSCLYGPPPVHPRRRSALFLARNRAGAACRCDSGGPTGPHPANCTYKLP